MALKTTINELRHRDDDSRQIALDKDAFIHKWTEEIADLYRQIRQLLKEYVDNNSIVFSEAETKISEPRLGDYGVHTLMLQIENRDIVIYPLARMAKRYSGILRMRRQDRTSEHDTVQIVRNIGESVWYIQNKNAADAKNPIRSLGLGIETTLLQNQDYRILNEANLEDALDFVLLL